MKNYKAAKDVPLTGHSNLTSVIEEIKIHLEK